MKKRNKIWFWYKIKSGQNNSVFISFLKKGSFIAYFLDTLGQKCSYFAKNTQYLTVTLGTALGEKIFEEFRCAGPPYTLQIRPINYKNNKNHQKRAII